MIVSKPTILVVEDDPNLNHAITIKLEKKGVKVLSAMNAEDALKLLAKAETKVDFIWLDLLLPGMNGLEFLKKIKSDDSLKKHPVAVVSVSGGPETQERAKELGAVDYLVKSEFKLDDLTDRIIAKIDKKVDK
jgi:DNA-binding response OmpR family regulator